MNWLGNSFDLAWTWIAGELVEQFDGGDGSLEMLLILLAATAFGAAFLASRGGNQNRSDGAGPPRRP